MHCSGILEEGVWHYSSTPANVFSLVLKPPLFNICAQNCEYLKDAAGKTVVGEGLLCISWRLVVEDFSWKSQIVLCKVYSL